MAIRTKVNPTSRQVRMPVDWPWISVPCQNSLSPAMGLVFNSIIDATREAPKTVRTSRTIHMPALPLAVRCWLAVPLSFQSCADGEGAAETLCQNSDVAIFVSQTSQKLQQK